MGSSITVWGCLNSFRGRGRWSTPNATSRWAWSPVHNREYGRTIALEVLADRWWSPICEKMVEYDIPVMIHVSTSCNACFHTTGAHYLNADTTAFMQCLTGDLFRDFPTLRFIIPHGGVAVPYHWGRFRGLGQALDKPLLDEHLLGNVFFDTCVYLQPGIDLLTKVIPVDNILFASEMTGAVRGIDPTTGTHLVGMHTNPISMSRKTGPMTARMVTLFANYAIVRNKPVVSQRPYCSPGLKKLQPDPWRRRSSFAVRIAGQVRAAALPCRASDACCVDLWGPGDA